MGRDATSRARRLIARRLSLRAKLPYTSGVRGKLPFVALGALAIGIVIGFLLGGIGPRREVAQREQDIVRLTSRLADARDEGGGWRSPVPGLDRILRAPPEEEGEMIAGADPSQAEPQPEEVIDGDGGVRPISIRDRWGDRESSGDDRLEAFQRAASIQRVRVVQSRAALIEQAGLNDEEQEQLDAALEELNTEIQGHAEELIILAMGDEPPAARDLLGITHDVTGILHQAQVRLEEILGPERMTGVDPAAIEIWNHVDLTPLEPAARDAIDRVR
jgi:hypothetical protein